MFTAASRQQLGGPYKQNTLLKWLWEITMKTEALSLPFGRTYI